MIEGNWHKKVRRDLLKKYGDKAESSHGKQSISLFMGKAHKGNLISNPDIIVFKDKKKEIVEKIIEIEDSANPKRLLTDIYSVSLANRYKIGKKRSCDLDKNIHLEIVYNPKKDKLGRIKKLEKEIRKKLRRLGIDLDFTFEPWK